MKNQNATQLFLVFALFALFACVGVPAENMGSKDMPTYEPGGGETKDMNGRITVDEAIPMLDYMEENTSMREMIQKNGRAFYLGTMVDPRSMQRLCERVPTYGLDWYCTGNPSDCYCREDPYCDSRNDEEGEGRSCEEGEWAISFLDDVTVDSQHVFPFQELVKFDFNYGGPPNGAGPSQVLRQPNHYAWEIADEIVDSLSQADMKICLPQVVYGLPVWLVYTKATYDPGTQTYHAFPDTSSVPPPSTASLDIATVLMQCIEETLTHYSTYELDRLIIANEAVRFPEAGVSYPVVTLAEGVNEGATTWYLFETEQGDVSKLIGSQFPRSAVIDGQSATLDVYGLIDDEIVKITGRDGCAVSVVRAQGGTSAANHNEGAVLHTIRELIRCTDPFFSPFRNNEPQSVPVQGRFWPWNLLTDYEHGRTNDVSDLFLVEAFKRARAVNANCKLFYNDLGIEFASAYGKINEKYENVLAFMKLLLISGAPVDGMGLQTHLATWECLTYDVTQTETQKLRLNPKQLNGFVMSLRAFGGIVPYVAITEIDLRMGIPDGNFSGTTEYKRMKQCTSDHWKALSFKDRRVWQGYAYKAFIDAALSVPNLYNVTFWTLIDQFNWIAKRNKCSIVDYPYTKVFPDISNVSPCILGQRHIVNEGEGEGDDEGEGEIEAESEGQVGCPAEGEKVYDIYHGNWEGTHYQKPSYFKVREAIQDYFGNAFSVKDSSGYEIARFVNNGAVIIPYGDIHEEYQGPLCGNHSFIVCNPYDTVAIISPDGEFYLKGEVHDNLGESMTMPETGHKAFYVLNNSRDCTEGEEEGEDIDPNKVISYIDSSGNLYARGSVIVKGVPYTLMKEHSSDQYSPVYEEEGEGEEQ